jgi:hypothetical protein
VECLEGNELVGCRERRQRFPEFEEERLEVEKG